MATEIFVKFRCNPGFAHALDRLAEDCDDDSRADLLERLILAEALRRGREMPRRIDPPVRDGHARQRG